MGLSNKHHKTSFGHCQETGKVKHMTRKDCKKTKKEMEQFGNVQYQLSVYKCDHRGYFHLGSKRISGEIVPRFTHKVLHK
jgi:hypothetical protein